MSESIACRRAVRAGKEAFPVAAKKTSSAAAASRAICWLVLLTMAFRKSGSDWLFPSSPESSRYSDLQQPGVVHSCMLMG